MTQNGLLKIQPQYATLTLQAGAAVLDMPCKGMQINILSDATQIKFPSACRGKVLKIIVDNRQYQTTLQQGKADLIPIEPRTSVKRKTQKHKSSPRKIAVPRSSSVPTIELGDWAYEKTARSKATHQQASAICRNLRMQLPLHDALSKSEGLSVLSISPSGEWGDAVNKHEAFMVRATPRGGDYRVIYKNHPLPFRCARKIK
uniref:Uncharacterized protein n=1 Tax=Candidatus Kentrum sp. LPFa TaxID=2126335 RepID=A0A450WS24_9GAMM|nr:MAG: hypothetical protein BECKLPF1236A_GA0070988_102374 [Candidatus Kentron sp. LPFa]